VVGHATHFDETHKRPGREKARRVTHAMFKMTKITIADLETAAASQ